MLSTVFKFSQYLRLGVLINMVLIKKIVAKALDGQRYPLPLCEFMWVW